MWVLKNPVEKEGTVPPSSITITSNYYYRIWKGRGVSNVTPNLEPEHEHRHINTCTHILTHIHIYKYTPMHFWYNPHHSLNHYYYLYQKIQERNTISFLFTS